MDQVEKLKQDVQSRKITKLRLVETTSQNTKENIYGLIYMFEREITRFDDQKFYIKTFRNDAIPRYEKVDGIYTCVDVTTGKKHFWEECEAYYGSFTHYDGKKLISQQELPNAVNDKIQRNVYECY